MQKIPLTKYVETQNKNKKQELVNKRKSKLKIALTLIFFYFLSIIEYFLFYKTNDSKIEVLEIKTKEKNSKEKLEHVITILADIEETTKTRPLVKTEKQTVSKIKTVTQTRLNEIKKEIPTKELVIEVEKLEEVIKKVEVVEETISKEEIKEVIDIKPSNITEIEEIIIVKPVTEKDYKEELKKDKYQLEKKILPKLEKIESKIETETEYNKLYEYEYELKILKEKVKKLHEKYEKYSNIPEVKQMLEKLRLNVKYDFFTKTLTREKTIKQIESDLVKINLRKEEILKPIHKKEDRIVKNKKVVKDPSPKKVEEKIEEIDENEIEIDTKLKNQKQEVNEIKKQLNLLSPPEKKRGILSTLKRWGRNVANVAISLVPLTLFKNKFTGALTSYIMFNFSLKNMRVVAEDDYEFNEEQYNHMLEMVDDDKATLNNIEYLCYDSLNDINKLRSDVINNYSDIEAKEVLEHLSISEATIYKRLDEVSSHNMNLNAVKKEKRKKLEWK